MLLIPLLALIQKGAFQFATLLKYVKIVKAIDFPLYVRAQDSFTIKSDCIYAGCYIIQQSGKPNQVVFTYRLIISPITLKIFAILFY